MTWLELPSSSQEILVDLVRRAAAGLKQTDETQAPDRAALIAARKAEILAEGQPAVTTTTGKTPRNQNGPCHGAELRSQNVKPTAPSVS